MPFVLISPSEIVPKPENPKVPQAPAGAIFDMDGVLIESRDAHWTAWQRLGAELDAPFTRELFETTFGMHNRQIFPLWLGPDLAEPELERLSGRKEEMFREAARETLEPIPGVRELIASLASEGFCLAVGSSGPRPNVEMALDVLGVREHFRALSTGDDVANGKPHPEVFLIAAERLGLEPSRCVVLEDAPQGVAAGLAAGARVIAITSTKPAAELSGAHRIVETFESVSPADLRAVLDD